MVFSGDAPEKELGELGQFSSSKGKASAVLVSVALLLYYVSVDMDYLGFLRSRQIWRLKNNPWMINIMTDNDN